MVMSFLGDFFPNLCLSKLRKTKIFPSLQTDSGLVVSRNICYTSEVSGANSLRNFLRFSGEKFIILQLIKLCYILILS